MTKRLALILAALATALAVVAAGCGGSGSSSSSTSSAGSSTASSSGGGKKLSVGLVTDIGGLNDRSFNHLAYVGLQRAEKQLGIKGRVVTSSSNSDYVPNLSTLARQHYDLVIGVGFLMAGAVEKVANKFPKTEFAIIDYSQQAMKSKPKNVKGLLFREQQAGYLAGYLAGLVEKQGIGRVKPGAQVISSVGGQKIPPVDHYIAGYEAGAKKADPGIKTPNGYSQDFVDQSKCKEIALNQIAAGSDVVFQVAGGCGLGALNAAQEKGVWGIGVDADQSYLGPYVLTSAVKKVDVAVFDTIKQAQSGSFAGGGDAYFDLTNDGVGIGKVSSKVPQSIVKQVDKVRQQIVSGKIANIPDTVK
jgi:basic membrane protein A